MSDGDIKDLLEDNEFIEEVELDDVDVSSQGTKIDMIEDYNFVREKLIKSIVRGSELIDSATKEAKGVPTARAIEAASGAVKTLTDVSKSLIDLHEKIRSIEKERFTSDECTTDLGDSPGTILKTTLTDLINQIECEKNS